MPSARRERTLAAAPEEVWRIVADPHHMPRWWPGVERMESVDADHFTQVFISSRGRSVRADFHVVASEPLRRRAWEQEVEGTPFERVLQAARTEIELEAVPGGTRVSIALEQKLRGYSRTGGFLMRRSNRERLDEALDGLERVTS